MEQKKNATGKKKGLQKRGWGLGGTNIKENTKIEDKYKNNRQTFLWMNNKDKYKGALHHILIFYLNATRVLETMGEGSMAKGRQQNI